MTNPATMKALTRRLETALLDHFGTSNATTYTAREAGRIAACVVRNKAAALATALDTAAAEIERLRGGVEPPTQKQMNEAFYVDVCRAEDRMRQFIAAGRALLDSLPKHWHSEPEDELLQLCAETEAVLNPHLHPEKFVAIARRRYGHKPVDPARIRSAIQGGENAE